MSGLPASLHHLARVLSVGGPLALGACQAFLTFDREPRDGPSSPTADAMTDAPTNSDGAGADGAASDAASDGPIDRDAESDGGIFNCPPSVTNTFCADFEGAPPERDFVLVVHNANVTFDAGGHPAGRAMVVLTTGASANGQLETPVGLAAAKVTCELDFKVEQTGASNAPFSIVTVRFFNVSSLGRIQVNDGLNMFVTNDTQSPILAGFSATMWNHLTVDFDRRDGGDAIVRASLKNGGTATVSVAAGTAALQLAIGADFEVAGWRVLYDSVICRAF